MARHNFVHRFFAGLIAGACCVFLEVILKFFNVNYIIGSFGFLAIIIVMAVYEIKRDRYKYMLTLLEEECDPQSIIDEMTELLKKRFKLNYKERLSNDDAQICFVIKIICHINAGEYDEASEDLSNIDIKILLKYPKWAIRFYLALSDIELENNDIEKSKKYLNEALSIIKINKKTIRYYLNEVALLKAKMRIKESDYIKAEQYLNGIGDDCTTLELIKKSYFLALVYTQNRRTIEAREKLDYVIDFGNKLCYVEQAKELMKNYCK
mgnify:CR=1 FL=1